MKFLKLFFNYIFLLQSIFFTISCSGKENISSEIVFVASTPGDEMIKSLLTIPLEANVDFIRWHLILNNINSDSNTFKLSVVFGESQPNTLGFKDNGESISFEGEYSITYKRYENFNWEIFQLKNDKLPNVISLVKLNDNLLHLLTQQNQLMIGNGGWSYTLNRAEPNHTTVDLPSLSVSPDTTSAQIIFDGRIPCFDFARDNNWNVSSDCFKLKWKLILNRDPQSFLPSTYILQGVIDNERSSLEGKWTIIKGTTLNPEAIIYQLDPDNQEKSISFLLGDENVIFFLTKDFRLYVGNADFSFTLNRRLE